MGQEGNKVAIGMMDVDVRLSQTRAQLTYMKAAVQRQVQELVAMIGRTDTEGASNSHLTRSAVYGWETYLKGRVGDPLQSPVFVDGSAYRDSRWYVAL